MYIMKKNSKKGFTLAELLIVIAILAILIAIMFPVFGAQLNKARAAAELANVRAKYSEMVADAMIGGDSTDLTEFVVDVKINLKDLASAMAYEDSTIVYTPATIESGVVTKSATIKVAYKGYSGEFVIDDDVIFTDGTNNLTAGITYDKEGTEVTTSSDAG